MRGLTCAIVLSLAVSGSLALSREKRADCGAEYAAYSTCGANAAQSISQINPQDASAIPKAGCNMIELMMGCKDKVSSSCSNAQFDGMMKASMEGLLNTLKGMPGWEESKCPAAVNYRNGGKSGAAEKFLSVSVLALVLGRLML